ncbi:alkylation response protein AidB-like acyl-CoA dehydrogenase [Tamaricihabitans halophyticus]|uniref:Alkylation response protein AidB-like acyl-CoA dehydrogenase n=1 Tax=Tamaricihabitans halophyticus TaxID=1262583 RepID=A0A4R2QKX1_9PSEU|nr:acyl-CoA dehydrogenase family protein [Tamaricihabitans halophyticus]TCP50103.1 alkylation response protein AidB-like acyl-CoA dehydrogenase [Tamaricihabitans halophyticus]
MTSANLLYTDVEDDLRASVRDLLSTHCDPTDVLATRESGQPYFLELWRKLAVELGVAGLHVPERQGGQGGTLRETAVIAEELGRSVAPVPFLGSTVLCTSALLGVPGSAAATLLERLAAGTATGALVAPLTSGPAGEFPTAIRVSADGGLHGTVSSVVDAAVADTLIVPALGAAGPELYAVPASAATITPSTALDLTRGIAEIALSGASGEQLATGAAAAEALNTALRTGAAILASEQLGIAQWCLDETVRYVSQRHQFGRPIGSFQALKHRLADLWLEIISARAVARYAADRIGADAEDASIAVATAQSYCAEVAVHAAEECIQLHGGIGMTWEHPAHLFLKRAKSDQLALGRPGEHRRTLSELVDLPTC